MTSSLLAGTKGDALKRRPDKIQLMGLHLSVYDRSRSYQKGVHCLGPIFYTSQENEQKPRFNMGTKKEQSQNNFENKRTEASTSCKDKTDRDVCKIFNI